MVDREFVDKFIEDNYRKLLGLIMSQYGLAEEEASAILHDSFIKLVENHAGLEERGVWRWFMTVVHHTFLDWARREQRRKARVEHVGLEPVPEELSDAPFVEEVELRGLAEAMLSLLSEEERELVRAKYFEGRSVGELSRTLGMSESALKSRLSRALGKIRQYFEEKARQMRSGGS